MMTPKEHDRSVLRQMVASFPELVAGNPQEKWWRQSARLLIRAEAATSQGIFLTKEVSDYAKSVLEDARKALRLSPQMVEGQVVASKAIETIKFFSRERASGFATPETEIHQHFIRLEEIAERFPDRVKIEKTNSKNGVGITLLLVKHPSRDEWVKIPLPEAEIGHKGGAARLVLNLLVDSPLEDSEYPLHDLDVVISSDPRSETQNFQLAREIGVDPEGIEHVSNYSDRPEYFRGRDTTHNQVILDHSGLYFTDAAVDSAKTGKIKIASEYVSGKAIYGIDSMTWQGESLVKPRGLARLVKFVVEGKAINFDYLPLNATLDMGIYSLFLAKRWSKSPPFPELLQKMNYLMRQMQQTLPSESSVTDVLERAHRHYDYFDFNREIDSLEKLAEWLAKKIAKQIDREGAWEAGLPSQYNPVRFTGDTAPKSISLDGFKTDPEETAKILSWWPRFLDESAVRVNLHQGKNKTMYEQIFFTELSDADLKPW